MKIHNQSHPSQTSTNSASYIPPHSRFHKHNKHLSKSVSQPKLAKISSLMLMTYQSPLLTLLKNKKTNKKTGWEKVIKARPCETSLDCRIQTQLLSTAVCIRSMCGISRALKLQGRWGPWSFRCARIFPKPCSLLPENHLKKSPISCAGEENISSSIS